MEVGIKEGVKTKSVYLNNQKSQTRVHMVQNFPILLE